MFHALDDGDVRAVLGALPDAATEGIGSVRLTLGAQYNEEYVAAEDPDWSRDPFTGRYGAEMMPGVFSPAVMGLYFPHDLSIHVHAFVLDRSRLVLPERACELFLRVSALRTLLHEVAHHHDFLRRRGRGRWLGDDDEKCEAHADGRTRAWARGIVAPHLLQRYPDDVRLLLDWIAERGGARLRLEELLPAPDWRWIEFSGFRAVLEWLSELRLDTERREARSALARRLYDNGQWAAALAALEGLASEHADDPDLLLLRANSLVELARAAEGLALAEALQARGLDSNGLWRTLCDALEALGQWQRLLAACDGWCASRERRGELVDDAYRLGIHSRRAVACVGLGDREASERWLRAWSEAHAPPLPLDRLRRAAVERAQTGAARAPDPGRAP